MKRIQYELILIGLILLAGCEQMAGHAVQLNEVNDPVIDDPVIEDPIIDDPVIDDPIIDDPDIPDYVEITDEQCNSKTDDERCEGNTMIYCGGVGIEYLIRVECDNVHSGTDRCISFNDDNRIVATCTSQMYEGDSCTANNVGKTRSKCTYLDFDYTGRELYYSHETSLCSAGNDGIYRWHIIDYNLCSDTCSDLDGCTLEPCTKPGLTRCASDNHLLICTQFKDGYYFVHQNSSCDDA
ncbi:MAG: hypothetical protein J6A01_03785 [Proteobacteria bacterium]|nr:hypothetical protein [Pseudomonadota bacterium]